MLAQTPWSKADIFALRPLLTCLLHRLPSIPDFGGGAVSAAGPAGAGKHCGEAADSACGWGSVGQGRVPSSQLGPLLTAQVRHDAGFGCTKPRNQLWPAFIVRVYSLLTVGTHCSVVIYNA